MKRRPFSRSAFSRRMVSVQSDHGVGGFAGLDEDDGLAGLRKGGGELLEGLRADDATRRVGVLGDELVGLFGGAVVDRNLEAVVGDVEGEILTHHGESDESDVRVGFGHKSHQS
jgi:hypothetical protein